ncbi:MAG: hypothetical protein GY754_43570 [bacterium]|nr:hypothetical protein [bacterium]
MYKSFRVIKAPTLVLILLILSLTGCSTKFGIERGSQPKERLDVELKPGGGGMIRTIYCDIHVEEIGSEQWEDLLENYFFVTPEGDIYDYRVPRLHFLRVVIQSRWEEPLIFDEAKLKYGDITLNSLSVEDLETRLKSPYYGIFNFEGILKPRRVVTGKYSTESTIDYEKDTIGTEMECIPPMDTITQFVIFERIPVQYRKYKLFFTIKHSGKKKTIDFDFDRYEYRTRGTDFKQPKKEIEEYY